MRKDKEPRRMADRKTFVFRSI